MSGHTQRRSRSYLAMAAVALLAVLTVLLVLPRLWPGASRLNNEEIEVDLNSGRVKHTKHFLFGQSSRRVEETGVSSALASEDKLPGERWVMVYAFPAGSRISHHFIYHSALAQVNALQRSWNNADVAQSARAKTAGQLLYVLREGGSDSPGGRYLDLLSQTLEKLVVRDSAIAADDIPDNLPQIALGRQQAASAPATGPATKPASSETTTAASAVLSVSIRVYPR